MSNSEPDESARAAAESRPYDSLWTYRLERKLQMTRAELEEIWLNLPRMGIGARKLRLRLRALIDSIDDLNLPPV